MVRGGHEARHRLSQSGSLLRWTTGMAALLPMLALVGILAILAAKAWPAVRYNGWGFFTHVAWNPGSSYSGTVKTGGVLHQAGASFGALPLIVGTVASSFIAVVVAVPVSIGAALLIVEKLPQPLARALGMFLEVLAGIPSVVFGLWGALTFGPTLARDVAPLIADHVPDVPVLRFLRGPTGSGQGLLTGGFVLAIMIIPIVAATARDLLRQVPVLPKEGALALGMTDWEVSRKVSLPWARAGIIGASVLGLARALGETMAVAMVSGAAVGFNPANLYLSFTTISATIVSQLDSAFTDGTGFYVSTLAEAALVLAVITLLANVAARLLVRKVATTALPVGRGV
jgi:phosphate transport system permease protein